METLVNLEVTQQPIEARQLYPNYDSMFNDFEQRIRDGSLDYVEATEDTNASAGTFYLETSRTGKYGDAKAEEAIIALHEAKKLKSETRYTPFPTKQGIIDSDIDPSDKQRIIDMFHKKEMESAFDVCITAGRKGAWWLVQTEGTDTDPWLDNVKLHGMAEIQVGPNSIAVNSFSEDLDFEEIATGLKEVAEDFAKEGLDLSQILRWINIIDEKDFPAMRVPDHIREEAPTAYVAAEARKGKGLITLNTKMFRNKIPDGQAPENNITVSKHWKDTFRHEIAHLYNMGLIDSDRRDYAQDLGWRRRRLIATDDYGNLIEQSDKDAFDSDSYYVTDDYGKQIYMNSKEPQQLVTVGVDADGKDIKPPSFYANENSSEDIAESFAAHFSGVALDGLRQTVIKKLIADNSTEDIKKAVVSLRALDPSKVDIWDYLTSSIRIKPADIYISE